MPGHIDISLSKTAVRQPQLGPQSYWASGARVVIGLHVNKLHRPEVVCLHPSGMACAENELPEKVIDTAVHRPHSVRPWRAYVIGEIH